jgi:hypothetical protein
MNVAPYGICSSGGRRAARLASGLLSSVRLRVSLLLSLVLVLSAAFFAVPGNSQVGVWQHQKSLLLLLPIRAPDPKPFR